jgi:hypothetical protein
MTISLFVNSYCVHQTGALAGLSECYNVDYLNDSTPYYAGIMISAVFLVAFAVQAGKELQKEQDVENRKYD